MCLAGALALAGSVATARSQAVYLWTGGSGGSGDSWRNANHWAPSASVSGPGATDVAVFATNGLASVIGINLNDGRGNIQEIGRIDLLSGPDRTVNNSSASAGGTLLIHGAGGKLLVNAGGTNTLVLSDGPSRPMNVRFASGGEVNVSHAGARTIISANLAGSNGFTKTGGGVFQLSASNTISGPVVVAGGTLLLSSTNGSTLGSASSVRVDSGAALQLGASNQLGDGTSLVLNGGTFLAGSSSAGFAETLGTLTLSASSTIDLGASFAQRTLRFADSSAITWTHGTVLTITNWRGVAGDEGTAARLIFGPGGLNASQLAQIRFADQGIEGAALVGPEGALTPIPEAPVRSGILALLAFIAWRERRRIAGLLRGRNYPRAPGPNFQP